MYPTCIIFCITADGCAIWLLLAFVFLNWVKHFVVFTVDFCRSGCKCCFVICTTQIVCCVAVLRFQKDALYLHRIMLNFLAATGRRFFLLFVAAQLFLPFIFFLFPHNLFHLYFRLRIFLQASLPFFFPAPPPTSPFVLKHLCFLL